MPHERAAYAAGAASSPTEASPPTSAVRSGSTASSAKSRAVSNASGVAVTHTGADDYAYYSELVEGLLAA